MYERALRGYEKSLGADNITTYVPALNTMWGLGALFERQADFAKVFVTRKNVGRRAGWAERVENRNPNIVIKKQNRIEKPLVPAYTFKR
jgi:hypothetical protein